MLMNGLTAQLGANGRAYIGPGSGGYTNQASKGTATWASPQAPRTATQAGFGTIAGGGGGSAKTFGVLSTGAIALAALIWIWWSLPR